MEGARLRVAIVGLGPKGLFALERLLDRAHRGAPEAALEVAVFEPHPCAGAGPVYASDQPDYLRMNIASDLLDMWGSTSRAVPAPQRLSYLDWRGANGPADHMRDRYPPRALVGRYLADGLARMLDAVPPGVTVTFYPVAVCSAQPRGAGWQVIATDRTTHNIDEVLIATGHRTGAPPEAHAPSLSAAPRVPAVFPVTRWLSRERIAPGSTVAIRGFALTFIDAALALTEGRGGVFEPDGHPHRLRYLPSSDEVGVILPFSRTGRPMLAKPEPDVGARIASLDDIVEVGSRRILTLPEGFDVEDLVVVLSSTVAASMFCATGDPGWEARAAHLLRAAVAGVPVASETGPIAEIERSLDVAFGRYPPDLNWALGETWRSLYPALVTRLSGSGISPDAWPRFVRLATQMERVAFGPPPLNAAKLLALVAAGRIDLTHLVGGQVSLRDGVTSLHSRNGERPVDAVVDAVLPGPGVREADGGLLARLVGDGYARIVPGRRGLEVSLDAGCIGADGRPTPGLAAVGRPTEDCVIGNDTLNRALHPQADHWARRVVRRSLECGARQAA